MHVAVLSPHLDDAVLSCWHVLDGPEDVTVVNVFTGSPPVGSPAPWWDRMTGATNAVQRMHERREEDRHAMAFVGRNAVDLGLLDAQYRRVEMSAELIIDRLLALLPPHALVLAAAALDCHPDHTLVRDAASALASAGWSVELYADLPHAIRRGWPAWVTGEPEAEKLDVGAQWASVLAMSGLVVDRLMPRVWPLDAAARESKLRALALYRTQRAALDDLAFVPLADARALAWEVSWGVPASALGCTHQARR